MPRRSRGSGWARREARVADSVVDRRGKAGSPIAETAADREGALEVVRAMVNSAETMAPASLPATVPGAKARPGVRPMATSRRVKPTAIARRVKSTAIARHAKRRTATLQRAIRGYLATTTIESRGLKNPSGGGCGRSRIFLPHRPSQRPCASRTRTNCLTCI